MMDIEDNSFLSCFKTLDEFRKRKRPGLFRDGFRRDK